MLQRFQPFNDVRGLGGVGVGGGQVKLIIFYCLVGFIFTPGDFAEAIGDLKRIGERQL
jgi:hypothetical protein